MSKIYAHQLLEDPKIVPDNVSNVPEGAALNDYGQKLIFYMERYISPRLIAHYCLVPWERLKKVSEHVAPTDLCVFGGTGRERVLTSPVVLIRNNRVLTQSGSVYQLGEKLTEEEILSKFIELRFELKNPPPFVPR